MAFRCLPIGSLAFPGFESQAGIPEEFKFSDVPLQLHSKLKRSLNKEIVCAINRGLTAADAQKIVAACKMEAGKNKWNVSIAVVDEGWIPASPRAIGRRAGPERRNRDSQGADCRGGKDPTKAWKTW